MLSPEIIRDAAEATIKRYGTQNPHTIAERSGIMLAYSSDLKKLLGLYLCQWEHRIILLNGAMDEATETMVLAHELGHDALHQELASAQGLEELTLFNMNTATEYEANAFAAHLLIGTEALEEELECHEQNPWAAAAAMNVHPQLMLIKLKELNRLGAHYHLPEETDSTFFKNVSPRTEEEYDPC